MPRQIAGSSEIAQGPGPEVGALVGRYEILRRLGAGAMGVVFAARDRHLERVVALKLVHGSADPDAVARLAREGRALARVKHPSVVTVYDVGAHAGRAFLAMELVEGDTLARWLRRERRTWREVVRIFADAGRGLAAIHGAGLVHRDFKPDNVLFDGAGRARVSDFGLARLGDDAERPEAAADTVAMPQVTRTGALAGTPVYMAPEVLLGRPSDARADQFSFFVALYEALAGQRPFDEGSVETLVDLVSAITRGAPVPPPGPRWLRQAILKGLAPDPSARFSSMEAVVAALERGLGSRRRLAVIGVGAVLAAAAAAVAVWWPPRAPDDPTTAWLPVILSAPVAGEEVEAVGISVDGTALLGLSPTAIFTAPRTGGTPLRTPLPPGTQEVLATSFRGVDDRLLAGITRSGRNELWELTLGSGAATLVAPTAAQGPLELDLRVLEMSPDGEAVLFDATPPGQRSARLWRLDRSGTLRDLGDVFNRDGWPRVDWSPDGRRLALARPRRGRPQVSILDAGSGAALSELPDPCFQASWMTADSLLCYRPQAHRFALFEIWIDGRRDPIKRYMSPEYWGLGRMKATPAGVYFQAFSVRTRLARLDLQDRTLRFVQGESLIDTHVAGWTADGDMIFGAHVGGHIGLARQTRAGRVELIHGGQTQEIPLVVLDDELIFARPVPKIGDQLFRRTANADLVAVGSSATFVDLLCAGDRAPPCLLAERQGDAIEAVRWDPETGARGETVARWAVTPSPPGAALSPDGSRLAITTPSGGIELLPVGGGPAAAVACPGCGVAQYLTWDPAGALIVTSMRDANRGYRLTRLPGDGPAEVLYRDPKAWLFEPRISPDGKTVMVVVQPDEDQLSWISFEDR